MSKEFPSMVWLSLLLVMSLSHSTVGQSGNEVIYVSCVVKLVLYTVSQILEMLSYFLNAKLKNSTCCSNKI